MDRYLSLKKEGAANAKTDEEEQNDTRYLQNLFEEAHQELDFKGYSIRQ
jgi:hypothetical protein